MFCCCLLFFMRLENALTLWRLLLQKTAKEYEATVLLILVKIVNAVENDSLQNYPSYFDSFCYYLFNTVLIANTVAYALIFFTLFVYSVYVTVAHLRGRNIFGVAAAGGATGTQNLNRGLS